MGSVGRNARDRHDLRRRRDRAPRRREPGHGLDAGQEAGASGQPRAIDTPSGRSHLQSRALKDLTLGFPEIVWATRTINQNKFVLDGELAIPGPNGFSFDLLVNRLRRRPNSERFRREVSETPAVYIVFDMLAVQQTSLLSEPFRDRRAALERFVI